MKSFALWRSLIIIVAAIPIAILTNVLRVSGTGVLARFYGTKVADGFFHSFSGWVMYIVAFVMLFGVGWLLDRLARGKRGGTATVKRRARAGSGIKREIAAATEPIAVEGTD